MCHTLIVITRATRALFQQFVEDGISPKLGVDMSDYCYQSECLPDGGV